MLDYFSIEVFWREPSSGDDSGGDSAHQPDHSKGKIK